MSETALNVLLFAGRFQVRGSSAYTLRLAAHLPEHAVSVRVVCIDARMIASARRQALPIAEYRHLLFPVWGRLVRELVCRDLATQPPDLIHIQSREVLVPGSWLARRLNRPYVVTVHDYLQPGERLRFDPRQGRRIIAVSQSVKQELLERTRLPGEMIEVIASGVDVRTDVPTSPVLNPDHVPVVGTAGPLEAVKGLPFFLGAAQRVLAQRPDVEFLIAGAGPEEANLRRLARELGIAERVTFVPNLLDFTASLAAMDIYCLPSLRQGLGTIMLEAMALGKPVIATGVGGVYSIIEDGRTGLVIPPSNSERLAARILELLADPARARAIGEAGRRTVQEQFGVGRMVKETAALYRRVLKEVAVAAGSTGDSLPG